MFFFPSFCSPLVQIVYQLWFLPSLLWPLKLYRTNKLSFTPSRRFHSFRGVKFVQTEKTFVEATVIALQLTPFQNWIKSESFALKTEIQTTINRNFICRYMYWIRRYKCCKLTPNAEQCWAITKRAKEEKPEEREKNRNRLIYLSTR